MGYLGMYEMQMIGVERGKGTKTLGDIRGFVDITLENFKGYLTRYSEITDYQRDERILLPRVIRAGGPHCPKPTAPPSTAPPLDRLTVPSGPFTIFVP